MNKQQFRAERSNSNVGTIHNIAYVGSREIVSEEMFMFIRRAATIQLDVASRSLLSKVGQFWKVLASNWYQTQLLYDWESIDILSLNIFPLALAGMHVDPK